MPKKYNSVAYLLIFPVISLILIFKIYPIISSVVESFFSVGAGQVKTFVGLRNFIDLFTEPVFLKSLGVTIVFNLLLTPIQVVISILLALLVNIPLKGIRIFRSIYYMPVGISISVTAVIWGMMLSPNGGLINTLLSLIGLPPQPFLISPNQAMFSILLMCTWQGVGYWMIFVLGGLQGIPREIYEAAQIDGSSGVRTFFRITLPSLKPVLTFVIVTNTVVNLLLFAPMYMLTDGGPQRSTNVLMLEAYKTLYRSVDPGRAYAIITVLIMMVAIIATSQMTLLREKD
jgi:multiple sugar transport system permease protein